MNRHLFNFLAGASLLLCIAIAIIWCWFQTHDAQYQVHLLWDESPGEIHYAMTVRGLDETGFLLAREDGDYHFERYHADNQKLQAIVRAGLLEYRPPRTHGGFWTHRYPDFHLLGACASGSGEGGTWDHPYRFTAMLGWSAVMPLLWIVMTIRARLVQSAMRRMGHCAQCGYDLRATPARCPECGAIQ